MHPIFEIVVWDALDWYSRNAAFTARRTVRADSFVVEIIMFRHTFSTLRHKQDSTLVAEQTAISSIFAFFVSIYSVFVERPG